jgi:thymidylate synthase
MWPIYKNELLILGNKESNIGVVTCWDNKQKIADGLPMEGVVAVGNLYSPNKGIEYLVANVLANHHLGTLIVCGDDKSGSGKALLNLKHMGATRGKDSSGAECWIIPGVKDARLSLDFSEDDISLFRRAVNVRDLRNRAVEEVAGLVKSRAFQNETFRESRFVKITKAKSGGSLPFFDSGNRIIGETVAEVWLKLLDFILKFGRISETKYQSQQKECLNLVTVITGENSKNLYLPDWNPVTKEGLEKYLPTVIGKAPLPAGISYYYSDRMRLRWGDQIERSISKLKKDKDSRSVVVSLWDPSGEVGSSPCLNHLWFRIRDNRLYLTATIRSNDMMTGYPQNALSMRVLQDLVRREVDPELDMGDLTINSQSAHLYEDSWDDARNLVESLFKSEVRDDRSVIDPAGMFLVSIEDQIYVQHLAPSGEELQTFEGRTALGLYLKIHPFVGMTEHAMYLGTELQKAEIALKLGLDYVQDKPLDLS